MSSPILGLNLGRFCVDKAFSFETLDILFDSILAHSGGISYCGIAWMALKSFSILAVHQIGIYDDFARRQVEIEDGFRQRKIIAGDITFVGIVVQQLDTSCVKKFCF